MVLNTGDEKRNEVVRVAQNDRSPTVGGGGGKSPFEAIT